MRKASFCSVAAMIAAAVLGGCEAKDPVSLRALRSNPTPELETLSSTDEGRTNRTVHALHINALQIGDDVDMIWLFDEPVHLSWRPIP